MTTWKPYPHQEEVADLLLNQHRNVILQAPTGAGKTDAALDPFKASSRHKARYTNFPNKCIYTVPMRVLANQFVEKYSNTLAGHKPTAPDLKLVAQQTGEHPDDPMFEARLTFATIDQVLSSFLIAPYGLPRSQANINAGAIISSYLVFDEFHLFDPKSTLPTALEMLRMLKGIAPFVIMTATFSTGMLQRLGKLLDAEVVGGAGYEAQWEALESQQKVRRYHTVEVPLSAAHILEVHASLTIKFSLVICNRVERAQGIFDDLRQDDLRQIVPADTAVYLLHARFMPEDRAKIERQIRAKLGKDADKSGSVIVVATQAIEVGVDISSAALHTELAPANSIVQRAGRCARYKGDEGDVYIYRYSSSTSGEVVDLLEDMSPYARPVSDAKNAHSNSSDNRALRAVIEKTWAAFSAHNGKLSYTDELAIIDQAHHEVDEAMLNALEANSYHHRQAMFACMNDKDSHKGVVQRFVRDSDSQRVIIHSNPNELLHKADKRPASSSPDPVGSANAGEPNRNKDKQAVSPYQLAAFNLHDGVVQGLVKQWLEQPLEEEPRHRVWCLHEDEDPESQRTVYSWKHLSDATQLSGSPLICVDPALAGYDSVRGFLPHEGTGWMTPAAEATKGGPSGGSLLLETYAAHIERVVSELQEATFPEAAYTAQKLEARLGLQAGTLHLSARLAATLHDTGKLSTGWQRFAHEWQKEIGETADLDPNEAYAHTDNYTKEHFERMKEFQKTVKRPPHAVESAAATCKVASAWLPGVTGLPATKNPIIAIYHAISCHHTPHVTGEFVPCVFVPNAIQQTRTVLKQHLPELGDRPITLPTKKDQEDMANNQVLKLAINKSNVSLYFAYLLLVRALRRADQRGTQRGVKAW